MEEPFVTTSIKSYLKKNGWDVFNKVEPYFFHGQKIIPDIVAIKDKDLLCVECNGSVELHKLMEGVGQTISYIQYGSNILIFGVPYDNARLARDLVEGIVVLKKGKIGVLSVEKDGSVKEILKYKRFDNSKERKTEAIMNKLMYVADITVDEIGRLLDFAYRHRGSYETSDEFTKLVGSNWQSIFPSRQFKSAKNIKNLKIIKNFFITLEHLGVWDHRRELNETGRKLQLLYVTNKNEFSDKIAYIFLTQGNWLYVLSIINFLAKNKYKSKEDYYLEFTKELIKRNLQKKSNKVETLSKKMNDRFFRLLREWNLINDDNKNKRYFINVSRLLEILRKFSS